ncbi:MULTISPECIES: MBL fold metallo-hydrolase [unclassified Agrococcus]|uniref:MBL fold metallo-hydrolase n=1 Tax=unclassified Agrococcus TaxID=2615065 RepID=UPI00361E749D
MRIRPGLHRVVAPLGERIVALYLLEGPDGVLLFDTGVDETIAGTLLPYLAEIGMPTTRIRWAITSHCDFDHTGGSAALLEAAPHVELLAGAADAAMTQDLELLIAGRYGEFHEPDGFDDPPELTEHIRASTRLASLARTIGDGDAFDLGGGRIVHVLEAPGHSPGHLALWDPSSRALVIGDAVLGTTVPFADGRAAFPPTYRDVDPYLATIERLRAHDAELLLTAHYPVFEGTAVDAFLDESADYVAVLDRALEAALAEADGPRTTLELIHRIAGDVGPWGPDAAEYLIFPVTGNLERLVERGRASVGTRDGLRAWSAA